jgi:flagellar hook-associated protein 3 FlgL
MRVDRFEKNVETVRNRLASSEGQIRSAVDVLQRVRELGVEGANGILDASQMGYIGEEVNALLGELLTVANAKDESGNYLFSGALSRTEPFRVTQGHVPGGNGDVVTSVDYLGNIGQGAAEISEGAEVGVNLPGNLVFWSEQQQVYSTLDARQYRVQADSSIRIDGAEIRLSTGDTVSAVIAKINSANAPVKARLDSVTSSLVLETTLPHQLWAEDIGGGTVLQDLGIIEPADAHPPLNIARSARVFGGSLFDQVIALRDALFEGSAEKVGSAGLRGVELAITSLSGVLAEVGARDTRLESTGKRLAWEKPELVRFDSQERGLDLAEAITSLKHLEYTHEAALNTAARVLKPSLLDFLR